MERLVDYRIVVVLRGVVVHVFLNVVVRLVDVVELLLFEIVVVDCLVGVEMVLNLYILVRLCSLGLLVHLRAATLWILPSNLRT